MTHHEMAIFWGLSFFAGLAAVTARLGHTLFGIATTPPTDPADLIRWRLKRRWLAYANFSALPLFATAAVAVTVYFNLPPITSVLISMVLGALGFGFLLNGLQIVVRRKLEIEETR